MKRKLDGSFIDAGVDWITVTAKQPEHVARLREFALAMIDNQHGLGFFGRAWYQSGYVGVACGHVQYGERNDGSILRLGGYVAKGYWTKAVELSNNVTRIDLQTTFRAKEKPAMVVHRHYKEIQRKRRLFKRAPRLSRICDDDGGYTVYTGRRCSNVMGRIYDKASESKMPEFDGCVRYEVQFNGRRAKWVAHAIASGSYTSSQVAKSVLEFFIDRGASLKALLESLCSLVSIDTSNPPAPVTDVSRKLEWLLNSVRPSVRLLTKLGLRARVVAVLGLNEAFDSSCFNTT